MITKTNKSNNMDKNKNNWNKDNEDNSKYIAPKEYWVTRKIYRWWNQDEIPVLLLLWSFYFHLLLPKIPCNQSIENL